MQFRVVEYFPDEAWGFAVSTDPFNLRKVFVHQNRVTTFDKRLQIGSLIEADICRPKEGQPHWRAERIRILK